MKEYTEEYNNLDTKSTRYPIELYKIWSESIGLYWYYTSGDSAIDYDGNTYLPSPIERSAITYSEQYNSASVSITAPFLHDPIIQYIDIYPIDIMWIQIIGFFPNQSGDIDYVSKFFGTIKSVTFSGLSATASCSGFDLYLSKKVPRFRFQPDCNLFLFTDRCGVDKELYKVSIVVSKSDVDTNTLTIPDYPDDWFTLGYIQTGITSRLITDYTAGIASFRYPIVLQESEVVYVYPGCSGTAAVCKEKFNNLPNFFGHTQIPLDNPVTWIK